MSFQYPAEMAFPMAADARSIFLIGGMNGAGKTSIMEAINYCLYGAKADEIYRNINRRDSATGAASKEHVAELAKRLVRVVEEPEPIYREKLQAEMESCSTQIGCKITRIGRTRSAFRLPPPLKNTNPFNNRVRLLAGFSFSFVC